MAAHISVEGHVVALTACLLLAHMCHDHKQAVGELSVQLPLIVGRSRSAMQYKLITDAAASVVMVPYMRTM